MNLFPTKSWFPSQSTTAMIDQGVDYMMMAAEAGDRNAMIFMARAFETGLNLGHKRWDGDAFVGCDWPNYFKI